MPVRNPAQPSQHGIWHPPGPTMQHLKTLGYFVAVAQNKSIREAAEHLHLTSSALNRHILDLEESLGAPLFERHARGVRLSAAGETYLAYARKALREAEEVHSRIDDLRGLRRGYISLATVAAMAGDRLMEVVAAFQRKYPKICLSVSVMGAEEVVKAVLGHEADLGIAFNPSHAREFYQHARRGFSIHALVHAGHPLAGRQAVSILDLRAHPLAMADHSWGGRQLLDEFLRQNGVRLEPQLVTNSFEVLIDFVRRTEGGVCFQIRPGSAAEPIFHDLVAIPVAELRAYERRMVLGSLKGRVLPVAAALFVEALTRELFDA
ncbi:LysR family transcriptional regulator [Pigmentiphaga soli]|uniref:LysR family transcriptional regulator n=1 Tax=Pigmentiphaga soli TaxID=1007095 RepID=A0ABP8HDX3_9BURK